MLGPSENGCHEPPHTQTTSSILLRFLVVIMMVGIIPIELDCSWGLKKYVILVVLSGKWLSGTSPYLEDIIHSPTVPDGDHDGWDHLHWTGFFLRFPNYLGCFSGKLLSGTSTYLEDVLHHCEVPHGDHNGWGHLHWTGFSLKFPKIYNTWVLSEKLLSGTSPCLEDIIHLPEVPDGDKGNWGHLHWTGFCLRFPEIYNTWGVKWIISTGEGKRSHLGSC